METKETKMDDLCVICQEQLTDPANTQILPCDHKFHSECIRQWIEIRNLCPLCKSVADKSRPVQELKDASDELSQQAIQQILSSTFNQSGMGFWESLFASSLSGNPNVQIFRSPNMSMMSFTTESIVPLSELASYGLSGPSDFSISTIGQSGLSEAGSSRLIQSLVGSMLSGISFGRVTQRPEQFNRLSQPQSQHSSGHPDRPDRPDRPQQSTRRTHPYLPTTRSIRGGEGGRGDGGRAEGEEKNVGDRGDHSTCEIAQCASCNMILCKHNTWRCGACRQVRYCSKSCQEQDWTAHKEWCLSHRP